MNRKFLSVIALSIMTLASCTNKEQVATENPFLSEYGTPYEVPAFDKIKTEHYLPAFEEGMKQHKAEVDFIIKNRAVPDFQNTILAYDKSGELLDKVSNIFFNLTECMSNDEMQKIAAEILPKLSAHSDEIAMNPLLFEKVKHVYDTRHERNLDDQQIRVVEKYYADFIRNGAGLNDADKEALKEINGKLSILSNQFGNNLLAENAAFKLVVDNEADLSGLPQTSIDAAAAQAKKDGMEGKWVFTLSKPSLIPFLQYADNRDLREKIYMGYVMRGNNNNANDNKALIEEMSKLRLQKAQLLGYEDYASYVLEANMAKDVPTVDTFLAELFEPALKVAKEELKEMEKIAGFDLESWDWWYYAEKVRKEKYDFDENELKPYLSLNNVRDGMFMVANKLYGVTFEQRNDLPVYFDGVETWEVKEQDGSYIGILYLDYFTRDSKSGGAWCTSFREAGYDIEGNKISPLVSLVLNYSAPTGNAPALLSWDETETLWHEFGHGLHALFSDGKYNRTCGVVPRDYVELPSQVMENWAGDPEVLRMYAKHWQTGEVIPEEVITKLENSGLFNQGFNTTEFLAAAILDMEYHKLKEINDDFNAAEFEKAKMDEIGLIGEIYPRYRSTYYSHIFAGGYSAGYYVYYWAAVLDSDAFNYFKESGDLFNQELAAKFRQHCLQECGNDEGMVQYKKFRGQEPSNEPFLKKHGLK